jgi:ribosomal protein S18 acetylase RimI-like enzyme
MLTIRNLTADDADDFRRLRRIALEQEPPSFGASLEDDRALDAGFLPVAFRDPDQAIIGAFGPGLVGIVGIYRDRLIKARHKAHIWGMYVSPEGRGQGIGKRLMEAAIEWANGQAGVRQIHLVVSSRTPVARRMYQSLGFSVWGTEPAALCINGELVDDEHMVRFLRPTIESSR